MTIGFLPGRVHPVCEMPGRDAQARCHRKRPLPDGTASCAYEKQENAAQILLNLLRSRPGRCPERYERNSAAMVGQQLPCALRRALCSASGTDALHVDLFSPLPLPHRASSHSFQPPYDLRSRTPYYLLFGASLLISGLLHSSDLWLLWGLPRVRSRSRVAKPDYTNVEA